MCRPVAIAPAYASRAEDHIASGIFVTGTIHFRLVAPLPVHFQYKLPRLIKGAIEMTVGSCALSQ